MTSPWVNRFSIQGCSVYSVIERDERMDAVELTSANPNLEKRFEAEIMLCLGNWEGSKEGES